MRIGSSALVEDLAGDEVGQRHLGGRDQPPAVGGAVAVLGELRQLAGAEHGLVADEDRGPDLGEAVLLDVGVEHELGERPVQADHRALHHHEAGAGEPAGGLEVEAGLGGGNLVVFQRLEARSCAGCPSGGSRRWRSRRGRRGRRRSGRFGMPRSRSRSAASAAAASASRRAISSFLSATSARRRSNSASSPRALAAPTSRLAALRSASAVSAAAMRARRVSSRARISGEAGGEAAAGEGGVEGVRRVADQADVVHVRPRKRARRVMADKAAERKGISASGNGMEPVSESVGIVLPQSGTASARSLSMAALARRAACSAGASSGRRSARTPARPTTRGTERATSVTPSISGVAIETEKTPRSSRAMAATTRARPAPMPYQVAPLPSMMV